MALGYCGSWLYNKREFYFSFARLAVNVTLAASQSCDHFAACAFDWLPAAIQLFFQRLLLCDLYFKLSDRIVQQLFEYLLELRFILFDCVL